MGEIILENGYPLLILEILTIKESCKNFPENKGYQPIKVLRILFNRSI